MKRLSKILYIVVGCFFPIIIGALHTFVHFSDLVTPEVKDLLKTKIIVLGKQQFIWNTWGIVSFMMGMSFIVIGLLNISFIRKLSKEDSPPISAVLAMIIYFTSVTYVGYEFNGVFQFYGGIFGLLVIIGCGILGLKE